MWLALSLLHMRMEPSPSHSGFLGNAPCAHRELHQAQPFLLPIKVLETAPCTELHSKWMEELWTISNPAPHLASASPYACDEGTGVEGDFPCSGHEIYRSPGVHVHIPGMCSCSSTNTALETIATHHPDWCQSVSASNTNALGHH